MTPKQKALQLVDYFTEIDQFTINGNKIYYHDSIKCALKVVDEIIETEPYKRRFILFEKARFDDQTQYWKEVKKEIEKL